MHRNFAAEKASKRPSNLAWWAKRILLALFVVILGIVLLNCNKLVSFACMKVWQWRVDEALPKGSKYEEVEHWCLKNKFQAPYAQSEAPRNCTRMIAWRQVDAENGEYLGIDFYFDSKMTLLWQNVFRGSGINSDGTRSLAEPVAAAVTAAAGR